MVAYSPTFCLPYLEGSDSPCLNTGTVCDPSSAWCDAMALVEAQLDLFDGVGARTGVAIPLAKITYFPDTPTNPAGNTIPFDIIEADTDNMVNFDLLPATIVPNRNGIYEIGLYIVTDTVTPLTTRFATINIGNENSPDNVAGDAYAYASQVTGSGDVTFSASTLFQFTNTSPIPRTIFAGKNELLGADIIKASLTVVWHSEVQ